MKHILTIGAILATMAIAIFGLMYIFDVMSGDVAGENLLKVLGGIVLLGACSAVITLLTKPKQSQNPD